MSLFITGMHRSGTSAIAELVERMGGYPGPVESSLMPVRPDNPHGYFERGDVQGINDEILESCGSAWWAPPHLSERTWLSLGPMRVDELRGRVAFLVGDRPDWYVKDPRIALTMPLWDRLSLMTVPTILAVRHPAEVVSSLRVRDGLTRVHGLALWYSYVMSALRNCGDRPVMVIDYEQMVKAPSSAVPRLREFLAETCSIRLLQVTEVALHETINADLRRHLERETSGLPASLWCDAIELYQSLSKLHLELNPAIPSPLATPQWVAEVVGDATSRLHVGRRLDEVTSRLESLDIERAAAIAGQEGAEAATLAMNMELGMQIENVASLGRLLADSEGTLSVTREEADGSLAALQESRRLVSDLSTELFGISVERDDLAERLEAGSVALAGLGTVTSELEERLSAVESERGRLEEAFGEVDRGRSAYAEELNRALAERELLSERVEVLLAGLEERSTDLAESRGQLTAARAELRTVREVLESSEQAGLRLAKALEVAQSRCHLLEEEALRATSVTDTLGQQVDSLVANLDSKTLELSSLRLELSAVRGEMRDATANSERERRRLEEAVSHADARREILVRELATAESERQSLQEQVDPMAAKLASSEVELGEVRLRTTALESQAAVTEAERSRLEVELRRVSAQVDETAAQFAAASRSKDEQKVQLERLSVAVSLKAKESERMQTTVQELRARCIDLKRDLDGAQTASAVFEMQAAELDAGLRMQATRAIHLEQKLEGVEGARSYRLVRRAKGLFEIGGRTQ